MRVRKAVDDDAVTSSCAGAPGGSRFGRLVIPGLLLAAVFGRAAFVLLPVNSDTAMFVYAGKLVAEGGRPGVDLLDNKLPSVGLLMSVPFRLLGAHWAAYGVVGLILSLVASWFLWRAARDLWGGAAGVTVALAAAVWLNFPPAVYGQLQLETIQIFFASIAGATALRVFRNGDWRDALLCGLCAGAAMWAKPTGGAVAAAIAGTLFFAGDRLWMDRVRLAGWLALGLAVPVVLCLWTIVVTGMADALPETLRQLRAYAGESTFTAMDAAKPAMVVVLLAFPLLILGWVFRRDRRPATTLPADGIFVALWFAAELAGVVSQRRMYAYHFLVLGPPAATAVGLLAWRVNATSLAMAFGPIVAMSVWLTVGALGSRTTDSRDDRVIAYVAAHASAGDAVWVDDYPKLLVETGRRPGSTVPLIFLMANGDAAPDEFGQRILADWTSRRPAYVAFASDPTKVADLYRHHMADVAASPRRADAIARQLDAMQRFLLANYHAEADIGNVRIYRLGPPAAGHAADSVAAAGGG